MGGQYRRVASRWTPLRRRDFDGLIGQNYQRVVQTRLIDANLVVADPFEDEGDLLCGGMEEV